MSLRKSPELTPKLLAAKRRNARLSTGPRTPAAKQNSKLNALKHGRYAALENHHQTMLALGEDPEEFESLRQELMTAFGPGDALWEKQIEDLAKLYWRRQRLERAQAGVMRRALLAVEDWQHRRQREIAGATFDASQREILDLSMSDSADPGVRLRKILSFLGVIREQAKQRTFWPRQYSVLETLYQGMTGWRAGRICRLLHLFGDPLALHERRELEDEEYRKFIRETRGPIEEAGEPQYQELLRLLDEEIASVQEEFQHAEKVNEEKAAIERDACLAPVGEEWRMMLRQEAALDRSVDRKVRILLALRKEFPDSNLPAVPTEQGDDADMENINKILGIGIPSGAPATQGA
jgi:hypothetical protein